MYINIPKIRTLLNVLIKSKRFVNMLTCLLNHCLKYMILDSEGSNECIGFTQWSLLSLVWAPVCNSLSIV